MELIVLEQVRPLSKQSLAMRTSSLQRLLPDQAVEQSSAQLVAQKSCTAPADRALPATPTTAPAAWPAPPPTAAPSGPCTCSTCRYTTPSLTFSTGATAYSMRKQ